MMAFLQFMIILSSCRSFAKECQYSMKIALSRHEIANINMPTKFPAFQIKCIKTNQI